MSLVFFFHYLGLFAGSAGAATPALDLLAAMARSGTDLFLVISGYGVYASLLRKPTPYVEFMRRRVLRIYPPFLFVLGIYLAASLLVPSESKLPDDALAAAINIAGNVALVPLAFGLTPVITVSWTLAYIMSFYLLIPAVVGLTGMRGWSGTLRLAVILAATVLWLAGSSNGSAHIRAGFFLVGMLVHEIRLKLPGEAVLRRFELPIAGAALALAAVAATVLVSPGATGAAGLEQAAFAARSAILTPALLAIGVVTFGTGTRLSHLLSNGFLQALGTMSYSYYLIHGLTLKVAAAAAGGLPAPLPAVYVFWTAMIPAYLVTLAASAVLFVIVERPVIILGAKMRRAGAAAAAAAESDQRQAA